MKNVALISLLALVACGPEAGPPPPVTPMPTAAVDEPAAPKTPKASTPSALALSCKTDGECQGHKCNTQVGKCSYPCASDSDCTNGATCQANGAPGMAICVGAPRRH